LQNPAVEILGISAVHGNSSIETTTDNALKIVTALNLDVKVYKGEGTQAEDEENYPLLQDISPRKELLGGDGGVEAMVHAVTSAPEKIWICALGPLTNIAAALEISGFEEKLHGICVSGGALSAGNVGEKKDRIEYNIERDPVAAKVVLESKVPLVMIPLEVTCTARVKEETFPSELRNKLVTDLLKDYTTFRVSWAEKGAPLYDPCAIAYIIDSSLFSSEGMKVDVVAFYVC